MVATATAKTTRKPAASKAAADAGTPKAEAVPAQETDAQKRNRLRNEAERHILNLHKEEFDDYAEDLFAKNGLTFNRRLSEAQKAEKKVNDLIAEHPELEAMLRAKFEPTDADAPAVEPAVVHGTHSTGQWDGPEDSPAPDYSADEANYVDPFAGQQG